MYIFTVREALECVFFLELTPKSPFLPSPIDISRSDTTEIENWKQNNSKQLRPEGVRGDDLNMK